MEEQIILEKQDFTYLTWAKIRNSSGTAGSFLKAYSDLGRDKLYYKLSNYDAFRGIVGHECVNELIVDRLLALLGIPHLSYQLIHADVLIDGKEYETYLCASRDFKQPGESKIALDVYYQAERKEEESPLDFCIRCGWDEYIYQMLAVDFLILNRDRHGANIEVLRNKKDRMLRLVPLFDHGLSFIFNCLEEKAAGAADVMEDKPVQSFVGSRSAQENLKLIPAGREPQFHPLHESDREFIFEGLDTVLPQIWRDKIWEMIWKRWNYYEDFRNQR